VLVGRDAGRVERVAADLRVRSPAAEVDVVTADFLDTTAIESAVEGIATGGLIDIVLIAHGSLPDQKQCEESLEAVKVALDINAVSPALYAEAFASHMARAGSGVIALVGSVAGDRGRKSNYVYGAAKGMLDRYAQGLQHRFADSGVRVVLVKPGPTDTPMTAHLKGGGLKLASVESVARDIVTGIQKGKPVVYAPGKWQLIMLVIRCMPRVIFNKLNI